MPVANYYKNITVLTMRGHSLCLPVDNVHVLSHIGISLEMLIWNKIFKFLYLKRGDGGEH